MMRLKIILIRMIVEVKGKGLFWWVVSSNMKTNYICIRLLFEIWKIRSDVPPLGISLTIN